MSEDSQTVLIGLGGGIASKVSAFLLKKQGFNVIGLSIINIDKDIVDDANDLPNCYVNDVEDIRSFCESVGIDFYVTDAKSQYKDVVLDKIVSKKLMGWANSSCFDCVRLRYQILYEKMKDLKADFVATGHFAKVQRNLTSNEYFIHSNSDTKSDQSMMLAGFSQEILANLILPLGELKFSDVLKIAKSFRLADIKQVRTSTTDFCFRKKDSTNKIIKNQLPSSLVKKGSFVSKNNEINYGDHNGMQDHYVGEKNISNASGSQIDKKYEIVDFEYKSATIYIGTEEELSFSAAQIKGLDLNPGVDRSTSLSCYIKFKFSKEFLKVIIFFKNNATAFCEFDQLVYPLIQDEYLVLYESNRPGAKILGYGKVSSVKGKFKFKDRTEKFRDIDSNGLKSKLEPYLF